MIRKYLFLSAAALTLSGCYGAGEYAGPAQAQGWRDDRPYYAYDRPYYGERRYYRAPAYREPAYRDDRPAYAPRRGYNQPAGPNGLGRSGVLSNGRPFYTPPGHVMPPGQSYETAPGRQGSGGYN